MAIGNRDVVVYQIFEDNLAPIENPVLTPVIIGELKKFIWSEKLGEYNGVTVDFPLPDSIPDGSVINSIKLFINPFIRGQVEIPDTDFSVSAENVITINDDVSIDIEMLDRVASYNEAAASRLYFDGTDYFVEDLKTNFLSSGIYGDATVGDKITFTGITDVVDSFVIKEVISRSKLSIVVSDGSSLDTKFDERADRIFEGNPYTIVRTAIVGGDTLPRAEVNISLEVTRTDKTGINYVEKSADLAELAPFVSENELAYGASLLYSYGGSRFAYAAVTEMTVEKVAEVLTLLESEEVYFVIPLTNDKDIVDLCLEHVNQMSSVEEMKERRLYASLAVPESILKLNSSAKILANNVLEDTTVNFFDTDVQIGDSVSYEEIIYEVLLITENTLKLKGAAIPVEGIAKAYSVYQLLDTKKEQTEYFSAIGASYSFRRSNIIFPETMYKEVPQMDDLGNETSIVKAIPSYFANCTIVGGLRLQRGVSNPFSGMNVPGFSKLPDRYFSDKQLREIQASGVLVCYPSETGNKSPVVMQQITTDVSSILKQEISIQEATDYFSKYIRDNMRPFMGSRNLSKTNIELANLRLLSLLEKCKSEEGPEGKGPLFAEDSYLESFSKNQECGDTMIANFRIKALAPFNKLEVYLYISL